VNNAWVTRQEPILCRDYMPEDLRPSLGPHGINKTVVVQTAPIVAETDFLLDIARKCDFIGGVVGWLDMDSRDFPEKVEQYSRQPRFVAVRPMLESIPEDDWILRPHVVACLRLVAELGLAFDLLTHTRHLPYVIRAIEKVPRLRAVVDHISKPEIRIQKMSPWKDLIKEVASNRNVYCKLSGMITEADHKKWTADHLRPYVDHVIESFGLERVMFGSDWPVCLLAGNYKQVIDALETLLRPHMNEGSEQAVFGGNAARFYNIK
jgi:L-fuconolactonase